MLRGSGRAKNPYFVRESDNWNAKRKGHGRCRLVLTLKATKDDQWYKDVIGLN